MKGTRWLLLKNSDNLNGDYDEKQRLEQALAINQPLATAYYLKEELKLLWMQKDKAHAKKFLGEWVAKAIASGINILQNFADTLLKHRAGIFSWYEHKISTGRLEGINNKIKVMKRLAYGYRDMDFFKLKIMAIHDTKYALI